MLITRRVNIDGCKVYESHTIDGPVTIGPGRRNPNSMFVWIKKHGYDWPELCIANGSNDERGAGCSITTFE